MHLTLHIQACCVISPIMEIDKRELSYHNPTYITAGNCYFWRLWAKETAGSEGVGREGSLLVGDQMLSKAVLMAAAHGDLSSFSLSSAFLITCQIVAVITEGRSSQAAADSANSLGLQQDLHRNKPLISIKKWGRDKGARELLKIEGVRDLHMRQEIIIKTGREREKRKERLHADSICLRPCAFY